MPQPRTPDMYHWASDIPDRALHIDTAEWSGDPEVLEWGKGHSDKIQTLISRVGPYDGDLFTIVHHPDTRALDLWLRHRQLTDHLMSCLDKFPCPYIEILVEAWKENPY